MDSAKRVGEALSALQVRPVERSESGRYVVPSEFVIRDCLVRIEPGALDRALNDWNQAWGAPDDALAIDSKTMKNALDEAGHQTHIMHYIIDWNYNEDRSRIHTGFGPENITRLRRFAVGILKSFQITNQSVAELMRKLCFRTRLVFDYLRMTKNSATVSLRL